MTEAKHIVSYLYILAATLNSNTIIAILYNTTTYAYFAALRRVDAVRVRAIRRRLHYQVAHSDFE